MVYIILVNWNSWSLTKECILSLRKLKDVEFKIVVCDNNSTDESIGQLNLLSAALQAETLQIVNTGANKGFAGGNNVGIKLALEDSRTTHVWLLNNDTTVDPLALSKLLYQMRGDEQIGICGSTLIFATEPNFIQAVGGKYNSRLGLSSHILGHVQYSADLCDRVNPEYFDYVVGASMLVSRDFIEKVGLMDEDYFLYCEELDWAIRAKKAGFKLGYAPLSLVYHKEGGTTGSASHMKRENRSSLADKYAQRSVLIVTKKHFPERIFSVKGFYVVKAVKRLLQLDIKGAAIVLRTLFSK